MPVTRGRARKMEASPDIEDEPSQLSLQETQEEQTQTTEQEPVDLKHMLSQLTKTVKHFMNKHSMLEDESATIQAGMDELHRMQEVRSQHIVGRLKNASSTILTFGEAGHEAHGEQPVSGNEDGVMN